MGTILLLDGGRGANSLDPATIAWLNQLGSSPSTTIINSVDAFIRQCKFDGNWTLLDRFWLFAQDIQSNVKVSIVNPTSTQITEVNAPTWTSLQGYTFSSTKYLNSNYNETTNGVNFTLNSACIGVYSRTNQQDSGIDIGHSDASNKTFLACRFTDNNAYIPCNMNAASSSPPIPNINSLGLNQMNRTGAGTTTLYYNANNMGSTSAGSNGLVNNNMYIGADNNNGTVSSGITRQLSAAYLGSGSINASTFYNAFTTLRNTIGF